MTRFMSGVLCRPVSRPRRDAARPRGFTLIEVLIVVVLLGLAGALVIPSMTSTGVLRIQGAVRTLVADITFVQGDALAYQNRRAIWFGKVPKKNEDGTWGFEDGNGYTVCEVRGAEIDLATDYLPDPEKPTEPLGRDFSKGDFGGALISDIDFNDEALLIFDELGGPVAELDGPDPGTGGSLVIRGMGAVFRVNVEAYTGRVTVTRLADE